MTELIVDLLPWTVSGTPREQGLYVLTLACLAIGCLLCLLAVRLPAADVLAAAVTSAGASGWLLANGAAEGDTVLVVAEGNGLTVADLAVVPAGLLVGALVWRRVRGSALAGRRPAPGPARDGRGADATVLAGSATFGDVTEDAPGRMADAATAASRDEPL